MLALFVPYVLFAVSVTFSVGLGIFSIRNNRNKRVQGRANLEKQTKRKPRKGPKSLWTYDILRNNLKMELNNLDKELSLKKSELGKARNSSIFNLKNELNKKNKVLEKTKTSIEKEKNEFSSLLTRTSDLKQRLVDQKNKIKIIDTKRATKFINEAKCILKFLQIRKNLTFQRDKEDFEKIKKVEDALKDQIKNHHKIRDEKVMKYNNIKKSLIDLLKGDRFPKEHKYLERFNKIMIKLNIDNVKTNAMMRQNWIDELKKINIELWKQQNEYTKLCEFNHTHEMTLKDSLKQIKKATSDAKISIKKIDTVTIKCEILENKGKISRLKKRIEMIDAQKVKKFIKEIEYLQKYQENKMKFKFEYWISKKLIDDHALHQFKVLEKKEFKYLICKKLRDDHALHQFKVLEEKEIINKKSYDYDTLKKKIYAYVKGKEEIFSKEITFLSKYEKDIKKRFKIDKTRTVWKEELDNLQDELNEKNEICLARKKDINKYKKDNEDLLKYIINDPILKMKQVLQIIDDKYMKEIEYLKQYTEISNKLN